ncbi:TetR family transcriptional regulator [Lysinibacillus sp. PLM2]|nr:TetR family transcriptional regulator [Lysinibacillus sp. PLM2]
MGKVHEEMTQRTKKEIQTGFIELVIEVGFQNVTVKNIAERVKINRGTFYLHFLDKYDVMEQIQKNLIEDLQNKISIITPHDAFTYIKQQKIYPPFIAVYEFVYDNAVTLKAILGDKGDPSFAKKVKQVLDNILIARLSNFFPILEDEEFQKYFSAFLTSAILGLFQEWLEDYEGKTVEDFAKIHFQILSLISHLGAIATKNSIS